MQTKLQLRQHFQNIRSQLSKNSSLDLDLQNKILTSILTEWFTKHKHFFTVIFGFMPFRGEPDLISLLGQWSKTHIIGLPVVNGSTMHFYKWQPTDELKINKFGIAEPIPSHHNYIKATNHTLVLTPALAIDQEGYRLGYGGGFYDRYRAHNHQGYYLGVVWSACLVSNLPKETWDLPVDAFCSEAGLTQLKNF